MNSGTYRSTHYSTRVQRQTPVKVYNVRRTQRAAAVSAEASSATLPGGMAQPCEHDAKARMAEIAKILEHAALVALDWSELVSKWVHLAETELAVSGQPVQKPQGGRPEGGVAKAARALALPGKTDGAKRKIAERAVKIAAIYPEAKAKAREIGLANNKTALIKIAKETSLRGQLGKVEEIRQRKSAPGIKRTWAKGAVPIGPRLSISKSIWIGTPCQAKIKSIWTR